MKNAPVVTSNYKIVNDSALLNSHPIVIDSKTYLVKKVFAFVKNNQLYIHISDGIYLPAVIEADGKIVLKDVYFKRKEKILNNTALAGLRPFFPLVALISDISDLSGRTEILKVYVDEETGELKI
jgi:hypothetical protein